MDVVEAIADAIHRFEGWTPPDKNHPNGSVAWRNRNPGNLRPVAGTAAATDFHGYRIFETLSEGWEALRNDITAKLNGSHGFTGQTTLRQFFDVYAPSDDNNDPEKYARQVAMWLAESLRAPITPTTTLGVLKGLR